MERFEIIKSSNIDGDFEGFDDHALFKFVDGSYWIQDEFKYWYYYSYHPKALILRSKGRLFIQIDGQSEIVAVREISGVIESNIKGAFRGWNGDTVYELTNGQVWQQSRYKYQYKYAYRPEVLIYNPGSDYIMQVAGTSAKVKRIR